jgi:hypothetical protein
MRLPRAFAVPLLVLAASACAAPLPDGSFDADPAYASPAAPARTEADALAAPGAERLEERWRAADAVFVGRVEAVGRTPGFSSGTVVATQAVKYRVLDVLRGRLPSSTVVVHHLLAGGATEDPATPRLHPAIFREGAELVVSARLAPSPAGAAGATGAAGAASDLRFADMDETPGPPPATPAVRERVRKLSAR